MDLNRLLPAVRRRAAAAGPTRVLLVLVGAFAVLCWCGGLVVVSAFGVIGDSAAQEADLVSCQAIGQGAVGRSEATAGGGSQGDPAALAALDDEQRGNGAVIVEVGIELGVPPRGWVIAVATATQESGLRNLDYGDRDSLGLFQQRPSQG